MNRLVVALLPLGLLCAPAGADDSANPIKVLFLGDNGHHRPAERFRQHHPVLSKRGIELTYTDMTDALNPQGPRRLRRAGDLCQYHSHHVRSGKNVA